MRKWLPWLIMIPGGGIVFLGIVLIAMYIWEGIIKRTGEPDQSLVFWYLPILFIGVFGVIIGSGLMIWGANLPRIPPSRKE